MYSTKEDFLKRMSETDLNTLTGKPPETVPPAEPPEEPVEDINLAEAISSADSVIDGYLAAICSTLPLTTIPKIITQLSVDIAVYNLHSRVQIRDIPEFVTKKYDNALKMLSKFATGEIVLKITTPDEEYGKARFGADPRRVFK